MLLRLKKRLRKKIERRCERNGGVIGECSSRVEGDIR